MMRLLVLSVALLSCGEPPAVPVVPASPAPRWLQHELSGVSVLVKDGWRVTDEDGVAWWRARISASRDDCEATIEARREVAAEPRASAEAALRARCGPDRCDVHQNEAVLYNQKSGWRWEVAGPEGRMVRHTSVVRRPQDGAAIWVVSVEVESQAEDYVARRRCLDQLTAAVSVAPGGDAGRNGRADPPERPPQPSSR
jgi:hypothetical protein